MPQDCPGRPREDHKSFLSRFTLKMPPQDLEKLDFAYDLAKHGHRNQFREGGERYFEHVRATALILVDLLEITDVEIIISALLHDILEDTFILNPKRIEITFGDRVSRITRTVTKPRKDDPRFSSKEQRLTWYHQQIKDAGVDVKLVKLADRLHNLQTLGCCSAEKQARKIKETEEEYLPLLEDVARAYPEAGEKLRVAMMEAIAQIKN